MVHLALYSKLKNELVLKCCYLTPNERIQNFSLIGDDTDPLLLLWKNTWSSKIFDKILFISAPNYVRNNPLRVAFYPSSKNFYVKRWNHRPNKVLHKEGLKWKSNHFFRYSTRCIGFRTRRIRFWGWFLGPHVVLEAVIQKLLLVNTSIIFIIEQSIIRRQS